MPISKYILNSDGTVPSSVSNGGYFSVLNNNEWPQDRTILGIVSKNSGFQEFTTIDSLKEYMYSVEDDLDSLQDRTVEEAAEWLWNLQ